MKAETAIYSAFEDVEPMDTADSERNLMRAVLRTAMEDLKKGGELHRDACRFFLSTDEDYLFSFVSICNHLEISPASILRAIGVIGPSFGRIAA
ncbi:MAG: hypothetical protein IT291_10575 [Deltaproteobacteria bacterium]|nr:hypothetical protein [Deltaproteobacteria bacterium]